MSEMEDDLRMMQLVDHDTTYNKILYFKPAPKQRMFYDYGLPKRERMFMAGNGVGKSESGSYEDALHLTGDYPPDWKGIRYEHPVQMWAACETGVLTRDVIQSKLCGKFGVVKAFGTGYIPKDRFADKPTLARGVTDAFDTIQVVHKTNGVEDGISTCSFKSFEAGREKFQGENLDFGHCDEEPPMDIYSEFLARIRKTERSRMIVTFTPLKGKTPLVNWFSDPHPDRVVVHMSLDEATWYTEEQKRQMIAGYPEHEREARRNGVPMLGSGRVFNFSEDSIIEPYIEQVPAHWFAIWGVDFGVGHPFGASLLLWDKDYDCLHVREGFRIKGDASTPYASTPMFHAARMKQLGAAVPVAWPHDGHKRQQGEQIEGAETTAKMYKSQGLHMLPTHATHPEGGYELEPVIREVNMRMMTGQFKVSSHCGEWLEEYRFYHRKDGIIVPTNNDILDATWKAVMMKRYAKQCPLGFWQPAKKPLRPMSYLDPHAGEQFFGIDA